MNHNPLNDNDLRQMMAELADAQRAGVFSRTPVDSAAMLSSAHDETNPNRMTGSRRWVRVARVLTPIAACLGLWVGVSDSSFWTPDVVRPIAHSTMSNTNAALVSGDERCYDMSLFDGCRTGPAGLASGDCSCVDFDRDGDVDFADFGEFQRRAASRRG